MGSSPDVILLKRAVPLTSPFPQLVFPPFLPRHGRNHRRRSDGHRRRRRAAGLQGQGDALRSRRRQILALGREVPPPVPRRSRRPLRHRRHQLDVDKGGLTALVRLSNGDMRKALNILQSTYMASPQITEEAVCLCTGNPMPKDIDQIASWLLNGPFSTSLKYISDMKMRKGLALIDIMREVTMFVFKIKMPSIVRVKLTNDLADIEYRLTFACSHKLQLGALISTFTTACTAMVAAAV